MTEVELLEELADALPGPTLEAVARALLLEEGGLRQLGGAMFTLATSGANWLAEMQLRAALGSIACEGGLLDRLAEADERPWPAVLEAALARASEAAA